jgi:hypothetical protein
MGDGQKKKYGAYLYFNYPVFQDTLFLVIDNESLPTRFVKNGDFVAVYHQDELIGVNVFHSNSYVKIHLSGLLHNPNVPLNDLIHSYVGTYLDEDVELVSSPVLLAKFDSMDGDSYRILVGTDCPAKAGILEKGEPLEKGTCLLVTQRDKRIDNGNLASAYLKKDEEYLIIGEEECDVDDLFLGSETYALKEKSPRSK